MRSDDYATQTLQKERDRLVELRDELYERRDELVEEVKKIEGEAAGYTQMLNDLNDSLGGL